MSVSLRRFRLSLGLAVPLLLLSMAAPAWADRIELVSGGVFYSRQNAAMFDAAAASQFSIRGEFGSESEAWDPDHACFGCTPGTRISLSQSESFRDEPNDNVFAGGSVRVDGVDYWFDSLSLRIHAGHFTIPDTSIRGGTFDAGRFVFQSVILGTSDSGITRTFRFHGKGDVSILFADNDWFGTSYQFADAAASAVPEPGTMLLFGSGAAAALMRRKRRQESID